MQSSKKENEYKNEHEEMFPIHLQNGSLRLRPARLPDDVSRAAAWYQDPEVLYYSEGGSAAVPFDEERVERMYRYLLKKGEVFIVELQEGLSWVPIGDAALCPDCLPIVIGDAKYRSQGLGKRVLQLLVDYARTTGWDHLHVNGVYTFNERSLRMYQSLGFVKISTHPDGCGNECIALQLSLNEEE